MHFHHFTNQCDHTHAASFSPSNIMILHKLIFNQLKNHTFNISIIIVHTQLEILILRSPKMSIQVVGFLQTFLGSLHYEADMHSTDY